jgi:predicted DNA-binding transcriptional regulator YafY
VSLPENSQDVDNFIVFGSVNTFRYTNYEGETEMRKVVPLCLRFGFTEHHPYGTVDPSVRPDDQQGGIWLLECLDLDRNAPRTFALKDIHPR